MPNYISTLNYNIPSIGGTKSFNIDNLDLLDNIDCYIIGASPSVTLSASMECYLK